VGYLGSKEIIDKNQKKICSRRKYRNVRLPCLVMRFVILGHCAPVKCGTNLEIGSIFSFQSRG